MTIFPKIIYGEKSEKFKKIIKKSEGVEIQFFDENGITSEFNFWDPIIEIKKEYPNLQEITVHPPLNNYNFEMLVLKDKEIIKKQLLKMVELSNRLNMRLNFLFHVYMTKEQYISTHLMDVLNELMKIIENTNVTLLLENLYMMLDERYECTVIEICKYINHPNLRACIDTTHEHCKANIYRFDFNELIEKDFNKEDCEEYVKQVHFAATLNNDGYRYKSTHGRMHENIDTLIEELKWLEKFGMIDKNYVTEVSEEDYSTREDQIEEIRMLNEVFDGIKNNENF